MVKKILILILFLGILGIISQAPGFGGSSPGLEEFEKSNVLAATTSLEESTFKINIATNFTNDVSIGGALSVGESLDINEGTLSLSGVTVTASGSEINLLSGLTVDEGGIIYTDGSSLVSLAAGTANQVIKSNGTSAPSWLGQTSLNVGKVDDIDSASFLRSETSDIFTSGTLSFESGTFLKLPQGTSLSTPSSGEGYLAYDTTSDLLQVYTGSGWLGTDPWTDGGDISYLTSITDDLAIGGTDSNAPFFFDVSTGDMTVTGSINGNVTGVSTPGSVVFQGASYLSQDGDNFFWNDTTNRLGLGNASPSTTLHVTGNTTFTGYTASNFIPTTASTYDLGSASLIWNTLYADTVTATTITATGSGLNGTTSSSFTINNDNATEDTEDASLTFERGTPSTNAQIKWDAVNKYVSINTPGLVIAPDSDIAPSGKSALIINQVQSQDILTASASGTTRLTLNSSGQLIVGPSASGSYDTSRLTVADTSLTNLGVNISYNAQPSSNSTLGTFSFQSQDDAENYVKYSQIRGYVYDPANGTTTGGLQFLTSTSGTLTNYMTLNNTGQLALLADGSTGGITIGVGSDLTAYHDGTDSYLKNITGATIFDATNDITLDSDSGNIYLKDAGTTFGTFAGSTGNLKIAAEQSKYVLFQSNAGGASLVQIDQTGSGDIFTASSSGVSKMTLSNSGNLGVGTTGSPVHKLQVSGGNGGNASLVVNQTETTGDILTASKSGVTKLTLTNAGQLIVGPNSASYDTDLLTIADTSTTNLGVNISYNAQPSSSSTLGYLAFQSQVDAGWITSYDTSAVNVRSLTFDSTNGVIYAGSGTGGIIYRCDTFTNCDTASDWTTSYDTSETYIYSLTFDSTNGVIYAGSNSNGIIYRCATSTGCDAAGDWTTAYDTTETSIYSLTFDSTNGVLYAGSGNNGIVFRCATSTGCDVSGDWSTSYDTSETYIYSLTFDATNGVLYAGTGDGGIIYRCLASTNCDEVGDWTTSYDTSEVEIRSFAFDSANGVMYAGTNPSGLIYRCLASTNCDEVGDWTTSYDTSETQILSLVFDSVSGDIYAGSGNNGIVYKCDTATACDAGGDWTTSYDTPQTYVSSLVFDYAHASIYTGTGTNGVIFKNVTGALGNYNKYAQIGGYVYDPANGTTTGGLQFLTSSAGSLTAHLTLDNAGQLDLTADGSTAGLTIGVGQDLTLYHDGTNSYLANITGATIFDATNDITLDADSGNIYLKDAGTTFGTFAGSTGNLKIAAEQSKYVLFQSNAGGASLVQIDQSGLGDIFTASAGAVTKLVVDNSGKTYVGALDTSQTTAVCHEANVINGATLYELTDCDGSASDLAEWYESWQPKEGSVPSEGTEPSSTPEAGDVVAISESIGDGYHRVEKATSDTARKVIGVVSTKAHTVMGEEVLEWAENAVAVGLAGRVPVKIDPASDPILPGDLLVPSDTPGLARKGVGGYTIGKALESWQPKEGSVPSEGTEPSQQVDKILVFLNTDSDTTKSLASLEERVLLLENQNTLQGVLSTDLQGVPPAGNLQGDSLQSTSSLNIGSLKLEGNSLDAIGILQIQPLSLGNTDFMGGKITMDTSGNILLNNGYIAGNSAFRDQTTVNTNQPSIRIERVWDTPPATINVDASWFTNVKVTDISKDGFTVEFESPPPQSEKIDWLAVL